MAGAGWNVVQTPAAAGLAWHIAHTLLGHHQPFFAPTAAAVSLSKNKVGRLPFPHPVHPRWVNPPSFVAVMLNAGKASRRED